MVPNKFDQRRTEQDIGKNSCEKDKIYAFIIYFCDTFDAGYQHKLFRLKQKCTVCAKGIFNFQEIKNI